MAIHTTNHIAQRHNVFRARGFATQTLTCRDVEYMFYIMSHDMMPSFPDFTHFICAAEHVDPTTHAVFGISDEVPEDFRQFAMTFEVLHRWLKIDAAEAAREEVRSLNASTLPPERVSAYLGWRQDFFKRLAAHCRSHGGGEEECGRYEATEIFFFNLGNMT